MKKPRPLNKNFCYDESLKINLVGHNFTRRIIGFSKRACPFLHAEETYDRETIVRCTLFKTKLITQNTMRFDNRILIIRCLECKTKNIRRLAHEDKKSKRCCCRASGV